MEEKLCECGCGQPAPIAKRTKTSIGHVKGRPTRFRVGHGGPPPPKSKPWPAERREPFCVRLERYADKDGPLHSRLGTRCWIWTGALVRGYGAVQLDGKLKKAHIESYRLFKGDVPPGRMVRHKCDNPPCCNPDHLEVGTHADNARDCVDRGRIAHPAGELHPMARLCTEQVLEIRALAGALPRREIAARYGVSEGQVSGIIARRSWAHV